MSAEYRSVNNRGLQTLGSMISYCISISIQSLCCIGNKSIQLSNTLIYQNIFRFVRSLSTVGMLKNIYKLYEGWRLKLIKICWTNTNNYIVVPLLIRSYDVVVPLLIRSYDALISSLSGHLSVVTPRKQTHSQSFVNHLSILNSIL